MSLTTKYVYHVSEITTVGGNNFLFLNFVFYFALGLIFLLFLSSLKAHTLQATSIFSPLTILEEELGAIEDYFVLGIFFIGGIFFFIASPLIVTTVSPLPVTLATLFVIFTTGFFVPVSVLQKFGIEFPQYIRGAGKSTNFFYEFVLDFVSILTIFVRFGVQNIRIVFLVFAYWELYVFVESLQEDHVAIGSPLELTVSSLSNFLVKISLYLYYVGHLCILYTVQIAAYLGLSFWLFFFLYTNFSSSKNENFL